MTLNGAQRCSPPRREASHHADQRMTLAGTVLRAADHGSGAGLARAGQTTSFRAVKRDAA